MDPDEESGSIAIDVCHSIGLKYFFKYFFPLHVILTNPHIKDNNFLTILG